MNIRNLRTIEISALSVSIIVIVIVQTFVMLRDMETDSGIFILILWSIFPYICLFLVDVVLRKIAPNLKMSLVFCVISLLMLGFTLLLYVGMLVDKSLAEPFIFLFFPIYLCIGAAFLTGVGLILALLFKSPKV